MKRREFIKTAAAVWASAPYLNLTAAASTSRKMLVLGCDGMDPAVVRRLFEQGELPNLRRLAERGTFTMMRTTLPPQSPVAWGSFISGADPGVFGIFDFIHRNPANYLPQFSESETAPARWPLHLGKYRIPLKPGKVLLKREGRAFWDYLQERDVEATIFKVPTNFPPSASRQRTLSGMGTPDMQGGYGIYTLYTSDEAESQRDLSPHHVYYAYINERGFMEGQVEGPRNDLVQEGETVTVPFTVYVDSDHRTVRIDIQGREILLAEKRLSEWVEIDFPLVPHLQSLKGMVKFYLLEMAPRFRLYVSPVHIDPRDPALPISTPARYSRELAERTGLFHTIGLPADFNAIKTGTFSMENYIVQSLSVFEESRRLFDYELQRFVAGKGGLLFFYFSSLDQGQHIFWALNDRQHPYFHEEEHRRFGAITDEFYRIFDRVVGRALSVCPAEIPFLVISDHGFAPFRREVNINTWLLEQGLLQLRPGASVEGAAVFEAADWGRSRAYGMGLNGLYLNQQGREAQGIVTAGERRGLLEQLKGQLESIRDPQTGETVISNAYIAEDHYSKNFIQRAPDIILGFNRGYRCSDRFGEGGFGRSVVADNRNWWSGDHCIDPQKVPASFLANFKINRAIPDMRDLAPTILAHFAIPTPAAMSGKPLI